MNKTLTNKQIDDLVLKAQRQNEDAFSQLFDYFFEPLHGYIARRTAPEDTEDLLSETWLRVVQNLNSYTPQPRASFKSWLFRIAHNKIIDYYRTYKQHISLELDEGVEIPYQLEPEAAPELQPDKQTNAILNYEALKKALETLPHTQREILEFKYLQGFSNHEIADIIGTSDGNVRVIQLRALRSIRGKLQD